MSKLLILGVAAVTCIAFFGAAGPAAAKDYEYCRRDIVSSMLSCGFDTLAQCQDMSSGRGGVASAILLSVTPPTPTRTRQLPASIARNNKGSTPSGQRPLA